MGRENIFRQVVKVKQDKNQAPNVEMFDIKLYFNFFFSLGK